MKHFHSLFVYQSHKFDSIFSETEGFRIQLDELTDGGLYTCHTKLDTDGEFDIHFQISMNRKFKKIWIMQNLLFHSFFGLVLRNVIYILIFYVAIQIVLHEVAGTKFVNKPIISSKTDGYAIEGGNLELDCTVEAQLGANFEIKWVLPNNNVSIQV